MKRAFLNKVKPVSGSPRLSNPGSLNFEGTESEQTQSVTKRRLRTSAAMVGLALSMGATGLLMPRHGDSASAAESNETAASASPSVSQSAAQTRANRGTVQPAARHELITALPPAAEAATRRSSAAAAATFGYFAEYVVGQGQTLQQIAQRYQIRVETLAEANRMSPTDRLQPGQVLRVPEKAAGIGVSQSPQILALSALSSLPAPDAASQQARDQSLSRLMQEQSKLKARLSGLRRGDDSVAVNQQTAAQETATANKQALSSLSLATVNPSSLSESLSVNPAAQTPTAQQSARVAVTPAVIPTVTPSPELDWMRANRALTLPSSGSAVQPSAVQSEVTLPGSAGQVTTALGLGAAAEQSYQVSLGDTVARIARVHNVPQSALISANSLSNPDVIFVGQMLRVPAAQTVSSAAMPLAEPSASLSAVSAPRISGTALPAIPAQVRQNQPSPASTQLAVVPSTLPSTIPSSALNLPAAPAAEASGRNPYVQNLLSEVKALRERHSSQAVALSASQPIGQSINQPATAEPLSASPTPNRAASALRSRVEAPTVPTVRRQQAPTVVAVAPLNPESYAPLTEQIPGRMVSPDLPALPGADRFLPNGTMTGYIWPAKGLLTSGYGWRWGRMHSGIDIAADVGTPIYAAASGVVAYAGWNSGGYGNMVEIKHPDGSMTRYAHMNSIYVQNGQRIGQSEQIGEMGSTGFSTGPHLHFEVHPVASNGAVNPMAYLPAQ